MINQPVSQAIADVIEFSIIGYVLEWQPADGFHKVAGSDGRMPNGIEASKDGKSLGSLPNVPFTLGVATTADGFRVPTETGFDDGAAGLAVAEPPPAEVEQAAIASAVIESSESERFVRMGIETSVSTIDRRG